MLIFSIFIGFCVFFGRREFTFLALNPLYGLAAYGYTTMIDTFDRCKHAKADNARVACFVVFSPYGLLCG